MNKLKMKAPVHQRGSFFVTGVMLLLLGAALTCVLKLAPAFVGNSTVKNMMATIQARSDYRSMTVDAIREDMLRSLRVNPIEGFDVKTVVIKTEGNQEFVDINYEVRVPMVMNISAIVDFRNRFPK